MTGNALLSALLNEAYSVKTWHGPNLLQSLKGLQVQQAAWRPGPARHNIWELALHAAYWKYVARQKLGGARGEPFPLKGRNFFRRPESGAATEGAWRADRAILDREHHLLLGAVRRALRSRLTGRQLRMLYGVAFHDVYHAGQIRLLRRLQELR